MTTPLTSSPAPRRPVTATRGETDPAEVNSWNRPMNNPHRSALLASASRKLAETARRIEDLQTRLEALTTQLANS